MKQTPSLAILPLLFFCPHSGSSSAMLSGLTSTLVFRAIVSAKLPFVVTPFMGVALYLRVLICTRACSRFSCISSLIPHTSPLNV